MNASENALNRTPDTFVTGPVRADVRRLTLFRREKSEPPHVGSYGSDGASSSILARLNQETLRATNQLKNNTMNS